MQACLIIVGLLGLNAVSSQEPLIRISQGDLRGLTLTNRDGGKFYGFRSIPYAQPPINELRFKSPRPADGWEGIRDATVEIPTCTQYHLTVHPSTFGEEDCLYLNVFIPNLPSQNATKRPVMVFIHGGGFIWGTASSSLYGPEFLMTKDIILVTINYRLGIFGFFNLNDAELGVPGNIALKDQVLALQWVKDNIEQFGGDRDNVLIFGDSAGSISVHLHKLSPMSAGLFDKIIGQSGTGIMPLVWGARNNGITLAEQLGIQTENLAETLKMLQELPTSVINDAAQIIAETGDLFFTAPIIELPSTEEAFLEKRPIDIVLSGNYSHVPYLTGFNNLEGLFWEHNSLQLTGESIFIEDFTELIPEDLEIVPGSEEEKILAARIKEFYFGDTEPSRDDIIPAINLYGDFAFCFPAYRAAREHVKTSSEPVFLYYLLADTELNFMKTIVPQFRQFPGAAHGDERGYLFQTAFTPFVAEGSVEDLGIKTLVSLWTNFATYGNPTPDDSLGFKWEPVREDVVNYLYIGTNSSYPDVNPRSKNMDFWSGIYEEYFPRKQNIHNYPVQGN